MASVLFKDLAAGDFLQLEHHPWKPSVPVSQHIVNSDAQGT
jgi:hypothetical protein